MLSRLGDGEVSICEGSICWETLASSSSSSPCLCVRHHHLSRLPRPLPPRLRHEWECEQELRIISTLANLLNQEQPLLGSVHRIYEVSNPGDSVVGFEASQWVVEVTALAVRLHPQ